jgi:hypothetical protein
VVISFRPRTVLAGMTLMMAFKRGLVSSFVVRRVVSRSFPISPDTPSFLGAAGM